MNVTQNEWNDRSIMTKIIDILQGIFMPIINVIMASAILKGILALLISLNVLSKTDGVYIIYYAVDSFFYFLPIFLAYTAAKKIKADPFTAMMLAAALLAPDITKMLEQGQKLEFLHIPVKLVSYPSSVLPIIMAVGLLHFVERPLERYLPQILKGFLKPLLSIIIVLPVTFIVFGPVGSFIGNSLANAYSYAYHFSPILAGFCLGLTIQPMVVFGLQWGIMPVIISNFALYGFDTILPFYGPPVMGQAGAAFAVSLLTKNKRMKSIATSGVITAFLGATEPILFGVTVPLKRPLLAACIAGGIGSGIIGTSHATANAFAFPSITTLVVYFGDGFWTYVIANILSFIIGFLLTLIFKFKEIVDTEQDIEG